MHSNLNHLGVYSCLIALRREYWIPRIFSLVKRIIRSCVHCRGFNERTIKLNQNNYKDYRLEPKTIPFSEVFVDYIGPYFVQVGSQREKVWVLVVTCIDSRAVNLKISLDMTTNEFLRSFSLHCMEYGVPEMVLSDLGSNFVSATNQINSFLKDAEIAEYFSDNNTKVISFEHYYKGNNELRIVSREPS